MLVREGDRGDATRRLDHAVGALGILERPEADEALARLLGKVELAVARGEEVAVLRVPFEARDVTVLGLVLREERPEERERGGGLARLVGEQVGLALLARRLDVPVLQVLRLVVVL